MARKKTTGMRTKATASRYETFERPEAQSPMRPDVGTHLAFKRKPPVTYGYDSSLSPALDWDGQNPAREQGESEIARIEELSRLTQIDADQDKADQRRGLRGKCLPAMAAVGGSVRTARGNNAASSIAWWSMKAPGVEFSLTRHPSIPILSPHQVARREGSHSRHAYRRDIIRLVELMRLRGPEDMLQLRGVRVVGAPSGRFSLPMSLTQRTMASGIGTAPPRRCR